MSRERDFGMKSSRSRSRSPTYGAGDDNESSRKPGPGDSTSDPNTVGARIFVGSINSTVTREKIIEYFSRFGKILGVTVTKNKFGFVQFTNSEEARLCLAQGNSAFIDGTRIDVKPARIGGKEDGKVSNRSDFKAGGSDRAPPPSHPPPGRNFYREDYRRSGRGGGGEDNSRSYNMYRNNYYRDPYRGEQSENSYYERENRSDYSDYPSSAPLDPNRPNDVEIIVPNKMQRAYAESIENDLKSMNLRVDLLFPPPDISPNRVISDLTNQQCLFAVFVTPENEKTQTISINALQGAPREYNNIPVEEGLRVIQCAFEDLMKKYDSHNTQHLPQEIRALLVDLLDLRNLSVSDLGKLIKYLQERQSMLMGGDMAPKHEPTMGTATAGLNPNMAITYPGYNYGQVAVAGVAAAQPTPVAAPAGVMQAGTAAATAATAYPTYDNYGYINYPTMQTQIPAQGVVVSTSDAEKQNELQAQIMSIVKAHRNAASAPSGVPPPTATAGAQNAIPQGWGTSGKLTYNTKMPDAAATQNQASLFAAYTPWTQ